MNFHSTWFTKDEPFGLN